MLIILKLYIAYIVSFWNQNNSLLVSLIRFNYCATRCHPLSFVISRCIIRCHLLYHSLYQSLYYSLWFFVARCHSLSFVVTRCTTRCRSLSFVVTRYHSLYYSLSRDVPLVCYFINNPKILKIIFKNSRPHAHSTS